MYRLDHILSGRHALLIASEGAKIRQAKRRQVNARKAQRRRDEPFYRAMLNCRSRLKAALRQQHAWKAARRMIGCTPRELKAHLESLFTQGMSWANYGQWHVDHVNPCARFDLTSEAQQRMCFHFSNLQPLWAADNWSKGDR